MSLRAGADRAVSSVPVLCYASTGMGGLFGRL